MERKLASIRSIAEIRAIPDADKICAYRVDGWWVVDQVGKYNLYERVIYIEVDSWVPHDLAPFLSKGDFPREYNGVKGERLKSIKLRGQISQGLLLPISLISTREIATEDNNDATQLLGIQKWEPAISANMVGQVKGSFPTHIIPKTDEERIQNCFEDVKKRINDTYEVTLKLDGSSVTIFKHENVLGVCSRNLQLKINEENKDNSLVKLALHYENSVPDGFAFQGEIMGPGIQKNRENFKDVKFFVFNIFDITNQMYLSSIERLELCSKLGFDHVPVIHNSATFDYESVDQALSWANELQSMNNPIAEGAVWKSNTDPSFSFKTISNRFLLKNDG